ncbi:MAG: AmmeMemoRadiSam system protein A [Gammaproteobacteria bacterium]|nr:AmmeMemoRadiSam system protein A [Gammaproteobacteria bacterium]
MIKTEPESYSAADRGLLLGVARESIAGGLREGRRPVVAAQRYPERLRERRATFVTLDIDGVLRGCIGSLEACRPLVEDVAHNAWASAFADPRFAPLTAAEFTRVHLHISVLSPPEPFAVQDEAQLLAELQPGVDGLILEDGGRRATFLPQVWASLPRPRDFLVHLKLKAGLPREHWSTTLRFTRYRAESIE